MYPREWNPDVLDLPIVAYREQRRPALKINGVNQLLRVVEPGQQRVLFVLLAATGMRVSEALALEACHFINDGRTILVQQQVHRKCPRIVRHVKTSASYREIDLHPSVTAYLSGYVSHKTGLIFHTRKGTPHLYHNLETRWLDPLLGALDEPGFGWHSFRRFRNT
jgi:integrase